MRQRRTDRKKTALNVQRNTKALFFSRISLWDAWDVSAVCSRGWWWWGGGFRGVILTKTCRNAPLSKLGWQPAASGPPTITDLHSAPRPNRAVPPHAGLWRWTYDSDPQVHTHPPSSSSSRSFLRTMWQNILGRNCKRDLSHWGTMVASWPGRHREPYRGNLICWIWTS